MSVSSNLEFNNLLIKAAQSEVSDLHLSSGSKIKARLEGELVNWSEEPIKQEFVAENVLNVLDQSQKQKFEQDGSIIFCHNFEGNLRFRVQLIRQEDKLSASLRFIPQKIKSLKELGLPKIVEQLCQMERGLVIVSGMSGAGKTTTVASMVEQINSLANKSIITLEQPIEFVFTNSKSLIEQREIEKDSPSFSQASRDLLNADVGAAVISRLPGAQSAANILELAEKCLVMLEMTSKNIVDTLNDFLSVFSLFEAQIKTDKRKILANNLLAVLNQLLVAQQGGGRLPVVEILLNNPAVAAAIIDDRLTRLPEIVLTSGHQGMISKERSLAELVKAELVTLDEALKYVDDKDEFKQMILS